MAEPRQATGTPLRELFADADRITELEREVALLLLGLITVMSHTQLIQAGRIARLEQQGRNDLRLSDVLHGIERRLRRVELGTDVMP